MAPRESITLAAVENLDLSIRDLADQLQVLREVVDEIREDISWATRNERTVALPILCDVHGIPLAAASPPEATIVFPPDRVPKLGTITGVDAVVQTVSDVADQVAAATIGLAWVRDEVKQAVDAAESESAETPAESIPVPAADEVKTGEDVQQNASGEMSAKVPIAPARIQRNLFDDGDDDLRNPAVVSEPVSASVEVSSDRGSSASGGDVSLRESQQPGGMDSLTDNHRHSHNRFDDAISALCDALAAGQSDQLKTFLTTLGKFHHYSFGNVLLISLQRPDATHVAGFAAWKKLGRSVRKGEKGIAILAPIAARKRKDDCQDASTQPPAADSEPDGENDATARPVGFRTVYVFDVSQTDGEPLPEFPTVQGNPGIFLSRLRTSIENNGIQIVEEVIPGGALGVSTGGTITIRPGLSEAEQFRTLAHEYGHELLHKGARRSETTKTIRETEAEAVAFAVCHAAGLGMNTSSSDYIQLYDGSAETLMASLEHIRECTNIILADVLVEAASFSSSDADS